MQSAPHPILLYRSAPYLLRIFFFFEDCLEVLELSNFDAYHVDRIYSQLTELLLLNNIHFYLSFVIKGQNIPYSWLLCRTFILFAEE